MLPRLPLLLGVLPLLAQEPPARKDPVQWRLEISPAAAAPGGRSLARFTATIEPGWHLYSTTTPEGPIPTKIGLVDNPSARTSAIFQPKPDIRLDPNFQNNQESYEKEAVFLIVVDVDPGAKDGPLEVVAEARYQACSDKECLRLKRKTASAALRVDSGVRTLPITIPEGYMPARSTAAVAGGPKPAPIQSRGEQESLASFLLVAFGFGLAAVFTPCVFPMIPITMSFFLNRERGQVAHGALFSLGMVVMFTALGLAITALLGPFGVVQLGSSPWVNGFISLVFLAFGLSMLGAFEITLPSALLTRMNQASGRGGVFGTMLMGLTFSLTSFACVGPFVGPLLAASVQGEKLRPTLGMATFALGLSLPFFLLSLFPSLMKNLPRSGGWLPRVKTVMGFVILAAMFYYLSNVDRVTHIDFLTRERFLAIWVILFAMPGLYLLGLVPMDGVKRDQPLGAGRALAACGFLAFSLSLVPGMFGASLGELEPYVPAGASTGPGGGTTAAKWIKDDFPGALAKAKQDNKLLFVSFTGYACTNCKWMKRNMFPRPEIAAALDGLVLAELYTDGTDAASLANQKLQEGRFQTVSIPHYLILDGDDTVKASHVGLERDTAKFLAFLKSAQ
jgi:thiol:disulfide interchange protein DsbD